MSIAYYFITLLQFMHYLAFSNSAWFGIWKTFNLLKVWFLLLVYCFLRKFLASCNFIMMSTYFPMFSILCKVFESSTVLLFFLLALETNFSYFFYYHFHCEGSVKGWNSKYYWISFGIFHLIKMMKWRWMDNEIDRNNGDDLLCIWHTEHAQTKTMMAIDVVCK